MSIFKEIGKWIRGWRLDKIFSSEKGADISIQEAAQKASDFLVNVQGFIISPEAEILEVILGDTWKDIVDKANEILPEVIADLEQVKVIPDVAVKRREREPHITGRFSGREYVPFSSWLFRHTGMSFVQPDHHSEVVIG